MGQVLAQLHRLRRSSQVLNFKIKIKLKALVIILNFGLRLKKEKKERNKCCRTVWVRQQVKCGFFCYGVSRVGHPQPHGLNAQNACTRAAPLDASLTFTALTKGQRLFFSFFGYNIQITISNIEHPNSYACSANSPYIKRQYSI